MVGLLIAGSIIFLVGLLAVGFGVPVKEFSFGNTLILAGALGACTGTILIALALVLSELKKIFRILDRSGRYLHNGFEPSATSYRATKADGETHPENLAPPPETSSRPQDGKDLGGTLAETVDLEQRSPVASPGNRRKDLLFMSSRRGRGQMSVDFANTTAADVWEAETPAFVAEPSAYEDSSWPTSGREPPLGTVHSGRRIQSAILKSGVVDGMAYSLYSDGSIEAQMPDGTIRFSSVEELREHLNQRA